MQALFQHRQGGQIRHRVPFQGAGDRCPVYPRSPGSFPQADPQILDRLGQCGRDFLSVKHMNRCVGFECGLWPLPRFDEDFQRVSGTDSGGHVIMLEVFLRQHLTSGAFMHHYVLLQEACAKGIDEASKADL